MPGAEGGADPDQRSQQPASEPAFEPDWVKILSLGQDPSLSVLGRPRCVDAPVIVLPVMLLQARIAEISGLSAQFHEDPDLVPADRFCQFADHALGNGDTFGLYWPFGREARELIVLEIWHDEVLWCRCSPL